MPLPSLRQLFGFQPRGVPGTPKYPTYPPTNVSVGHPGHVKPIAQGKAPGRKAGRS